MYDIRNIILTIIDNLQNLVLIVIMILMFYSSTNVNRFKISSLKKLFLTICILCSCAIFLQVVIIILKIELHTVSIFSFISLVIDFLVFIRSREKYNVFKNM